MALEKEMEFKNKGGNKVFLFITLAAIIILIIIAIIAYFFLKSNAVPETMPQQTSNSYSIKDTNLLNPGPIYTLDKPFVVNLITQNARRYLKASLSLEISTSKLQNEIEQKMPAIKDIVIDVLSSKTIEEVSTIKGKERIKEDILQRLNQILIDGQVKNIFFTEFVVQ